MLYIGRPGVSPAVAALIALGKIRRDHRILDVGCGIGTDALLLGKWGFRHVDAIDPDARSIGIAKARAKRMAVGRHVRFHAIPAEDLAEAFHPVRFDVVLHTLVANNLTKHKEKHFRNVATVMKPGGLLVLHERVRRLDENLRPGAFPPLAAARRSFRLTASVSTHLAESHRARSPPAYARVVLWFGTPRRSVRRGTEKEAAESLRP